MSLTEGERLNILALEPYYGGSHRAFLDTLIRHSRHRFTLLTLPARKWKWRMRGAAIWFARRLEQSALGPFDLIFTTDMLSVSDLRALLPTALRGCPVVCYFHENQLTYPLADEETRDYHYGFTNITTCLASNAVWFNSRTHREAFLEAAGKLLTKMPDHVPSGIIDDIRRRSSVCWPLVEPPPQRRSAATPGKPRTILWNHRWEHDKAPETLFEALFRLDGSGVEFRVAILGESFREVPAIFSRAWKRLQRRIIHKGHAPSRADYWRILRECDIVVSTAIQENFGISVVEAILAGCRPLLPNRLSYPELLPPSKHADYLYEEPDELHARLLDLLTTGEPWRIDREIMDGLWSGCVVTECISRYDTMLESAGHFG